MIAVSALITNLTLNTLKLVQIGNFTEAGLPTDDIFGLQQELRLPDFVDDGVEVESLTGTTA